MKSTAYGTPGIFIPIKNHFEQEQGAARFGFKYEDIFRLDHPIEEKIGCRRNAMNMKGAAKVGENYFYAYVMYTTVGKSCISEK